jgi:hypothetical protein
MYNLQGFVESVERLLRRHALPQAGQYARWTAVSHPPADCGPNPYGCADAANILYTIGALPSAGPERAAHVETLRAMQDPSSGLYHEATHHDYHCTAHCIAALELFDERPAHRLAAMQTLLEQGALERFLDGLDWRSSPWNASHQGAGVWAAMEIANQATAEWSDRYFQWLWQEADESSGFWRRGCTAAAGAAPLFHHLAGTFHYLFNHQHARRPLRYPDRLIDTCMEVGFANIGRGISFAEIDWVYCITRALAQCGHRFGDCMAALRAFAAKYIPWLLSLDVARDPRCDDLHGIFGCLCCLAELQRALPGELRTHRPLNLVLDRRPFI